MSSALPMLGLVAATSGDGLAAAALDRLAATSASAPVAVEPSVTDPVVDLAALAADASVAAILLIVLPILGAAGALVAALVRARSGWLVALATLALEAVLAARLLLAVWREDRVVHALGAYGETEAGYAVGIELVADGLSAPVVAVVAAVALGVLAISRRLGPRGNAFYGAYLLLVAGLMGVSLTGDVFNLFVFLEITGLATYTLVAARQHAEAAVAALKYLIVGTTGASLYLIGVGYLFLATGTLNMADLSRTLACEGTVPHVAACGTEGATLYSDPLVLAGFGFVAAGLLVKAAIFPLHTWQPDAYAEAPDAVTTLISALVSTAAAYAFARVALFVFGPAFFAANRIAATAVVTLAAGSVVAGASLAVTQSDVKRTFAYSSVSQFGLVVAAVGVAVHPAAAESVAPDAFGASAAEPARLALLGAVIHLVGHAVVKGGVFASAAGLAASVDARRVREYAELGRDAPVLAGCLAVLGLTLVGVPPTVGFLGKWYIALGAIQAGLWPLAVVVLVSTLLTLTYVGRMLERLYFTPADDAAEPAGAGATDDGPGSGPAARDGAVATDGGPELERDAGRGLLGLRRAPLGLVAYVLAATVAAVALGFAGDAFATLLDPVTVEVFGR